MITRIKNEQHRKTIFVATLTALIIGMIMAFNRSSAAPVFNQEMTLEEQADSTKNKAKADKADSSKVYTVVERPAEFPGGMEGWRSYLEANLKYPKKAQKRKTQGVVKLRMVVNKDGSVADLVVMSDPGDGLAEEAIRVIQKGPKWVPAWQNGKNVTYRFVQTITFQLQ